MSRTPTYKSWVGMIERCTNKNGRYYRHYGGRGIQVCERWMTFQNFFDDMGERPSRKHSIDRYPNNDGDYEPGNCRWATDKEQQRNRRCNRLLTYQGQTFTLAEWRERLGISKPTMTYRLKHWTVEEALGTPIGEKRGVCKETAVAEELGVVQSRG